MWIFTQAEPPKIPQPILIVIEARAEEQLEEPKPKLYTLEEKIELDINGCEPERYISAEDASCLDKPVYTPPAPKEQSKPIKSSSKSASRATSGWYPYGQCTFYVSTQRSVGQWNNASEWIWQAQRDGWSTGSTPRVGAIAQKNNHVAIVRSVSGNTMTIQEMNYRGVGVVTTRTISSSGWRFIY